MGESAFRSDAQVVEPHDCRVLGTRSVHAAVEIPGPLQGLTLVVATVNHLAGLAVIINNPLFS